MGVHLRHTIRCEADVCSPRSEGCVHKQESPNVEQQVQMLDVNVVDGLAQVGR
jgi:hypothetical protein